MSALASELGAAFAWLVELIDFFVALMLVLALWVLVVRLLDWPSRHHRQHR